MGERDRRRDRPDLLADDVRVVGGNKLGVVRQIDGVRSESAFGERACYAPPAGRALARAVNEDDVVHAKRPPARMSAASRQEAPSRG